MPSVARGTCYTCQMIGGHVASSTLVCLSLSLSLSRSNSSPIEHTSECEGGHPPLSCSYPLSSLSLRSIHSLPHPRAPRSASSVVDLVCSSVRRSDGLGTNEGRPLSLSSPSFLSLSLSLSLCFAQQKKVSLSCLSLLSSSLISFPSQLCPTC